MSRYLHIFVAYIEIYFFRLTGSQWIANETVLLLKRIIAQSKWTNALELMTLVKSEGSVLSSRLSSEVIVGNLTRRVLKLIREEYLSCLKGRQEEGGNKSTHWCGRLLKRRKGQENGLIFIVNI